MSDLNKAWHYEIHPHNEFQLVNIYGEPALFDKPEFGGFWLKCISCSFSCREDGPTVEEFLGLPIAKFIANGDLETEIVYEGSDFKTLTGKLFIHTMILEYPGPRLLAMVNEDGYVSCVDWPPVISEERQLCQI